MDREVFRVFDAVLVGAGPVGLFGAYYAGLRGMSIEVIDSLGQPGGQLITLYPEKFIYDVPGFPAVLSKTLVSELVRQAAQYEPVLTMNARVDALARRQDGTFELTTDKGVHRSRSVVVCAGAGSFVPKKLPDANTAAYEGRGLDYFVRDVAACRDKRVLIVGGGDSAVDWALGLLRVTKKIALVHRNDTFRAHEDSVAKLFASPVTVRTFSELKRVHGDGRVQAATVVHNRTGKAVLLDVDRIIVNIGFSTSLGAIRHWGLPMDQHGVVVNSRMETSIPGVYAAGDVASYPGKLKLIATGFSEAAIAVNHAKAFTDPASKCFPGHSSMLVPKRRKSGQ